MPKLSVNLEQIRDKLILQLWEERFTNFLEVKDIGRIFHLSVSTVYKIIKDKTIIKS